MRRKPLTLSVVGLGVVGVGTAFGVVAAVLVLGLVLLWHPLVPAACRALARRCRSRATLLRLRKAVVLVAVVATTAGLFAAPAVAASDRGGIDLSWLQDLIERWRKPAPGTTPPRPTSTTATTSTTRPTTTAPPTTTTTAVPTTTVPTTTTPTTTTITTVPPTTTTSSPTTGVPAPDRPAGAARTFWLHFNGTPTSDEMLAREAKRHSYIVLNAWEGALIPKLKAANPAVQVYVYKDLSSTRSYACRNGVDDAQLPTGVGYCQADREHPEWFLKNPQGQRFTYDGYSGHWQMDIGDVGYQNAWAGNVIAAAKATGFDGVFMDNALFPCDAYHPGVCPAKYPTDASFQTAYKAMLGAMQGRFASAGLKTVANMSNARLHAGAWNAYLTYLDGGFDEWWLVFGDDNFLPEYSEGWSRQVAEITDNEARGKMTWVQPHFSPTNDRARAYALASYFIANGSRAAIAEITVQDGYGDPMPRYPEYEWNLGTPVGTPRAVATGVYRRDFSCGTALVNANAGSAPAVTVSLSGSYLDALGMSVGTVSLPSRSGAILRKAC
ncbi:MAG: hypothetical protein HOY78_22945 [Saccharothrix sp.]|nr:hypothetical protein [Saccharothrix sp.]